MTDTAAFIDQTSYESYPSWQTGRACEIGDTLHGRIVNRPKVIERPDDETGDLRRILILDVETLKGCGGKVKDGDDTRPVNVGETVTLWAEAGKGITRAISSAVKKAGERDIVEGGVITVKFTATGTPAKKGWSAPKIFSAKYAPPLSGVDVDDLGV